MRYDRDFGDRGRGRRRDESELVGRGEYGDAYEAPYRGRPRGFRGFGTGYLGGALRSRGSYEAGQIRSGLNPRDEFEFEWGDGYVGGRGYGGTNRDYEVGYRTGGERDVYGPARYGYGPYHERLRRQHRADDEIREDVAEALFYDTWVDAERIAVEVEDGIVTLRGRLPSYDEVRYATDDAWDVDGVRGVRSALEVDEEPATELLARRRGYDAAQIAEENLERTAGGTMGTRGRVGSPDGGTAPRGTEDQGGY